jgi:hypothetical protein
MRVAAEAPLPLPTTGKLFPVSRILAPIGKLASIPATAPLGSRCVTSTAQAPQSPVNPFNHHASNCR